jgi:BASS family bile acid:Na+ symporter
MDTLIGIAAPAVTFALLVAIGLDLKADDFIRVRRQTGVVLTGFLAPVILLPPIALALTRIFQASPDITAGLLLVAASPIGGISNTYSYLARASTALSITLTGLSSVFAVVTIPLIGAGLELALGRPMGLRPPIPVLLTQITVVLALPIAIGVLMRRRWPALGQRHRPLLQRAVFIGLVVLLLAIIAQDPKAVLGGWSTSIPIAAMFVFTSMAAGWSAAALVTDDRRDRFTLAAEFGTRNVGVAMAIAVTLLGRIELAQFAVTYFLIEMPLLMGAAVWFRRRQERLESSPQDPALR